MEESVTTSGGGWVQIVLDTETLLKANKTVNLLDVMARVGFHLEYPDNVHVPRSVFDGLICLRARHRRGEEQLAAIRKIKAFSERGGAELTETSLSLSEEDVRRIARKVAEEVVEEYDKQLSEFVTRKIQSAFADWNNEMERRGKVFKAEITKAVAEYDRDIRRDIRADILSELHKRLNPELKVKEDDE